MSLNLNVPTSEAQLKPRITVIGVGGAGGNAVNNMIQSNLEGVEFVVANTDAQAIAQSLCSRTLQLGRNITQGLGSGSRPDIGKAAAEEALDEILADLEGAHMVFITAGMGGGTGTGAAPVIARAAREQGILTVGVVTKPFHFEGVHRMRIAESGIQELTQFVDTLIIIPNQNLFRIANEKTTFADAFKMADDVLHAGVRGVTDLMVMPGLINLDFADIRTVMTEMGKAMMGTGEADGDNRAIAAAEAAISNPLLEDVSMKGARGVLINITGGPDLTLFEVDEAANRIRDEVDPEANIIFGSTYDDKMENQMRVSVVATGIDIAEGAKPRPVTLSLVANPAAGGAQAAPAGNAAEGGDQITAQAAAEVPAQPMAQPAAQSIVSEPQPSAAPDQAGEAPLELTEPLVEEVRETAQAVSSEPPAGETFIAPQPMDPGQEASAPMVQANPFAAADVVNAPPAAPPSEAPAVPQAQSAAAQGALAESRTVGDPVSPATRSRAQAILARMSGAARALQAAAQGHDTAESRPAQPKVEAAPQPQVQAQPQVQPQFVARPQATAHEAPKLEARVEEHQPAPSSGEGQPRLTGLDPADRPSNSPVDDDLLDIPAFLRRQAN
ncbi:MAG: cell division protein FtsZ [Kiloniellales bacterium]|nr:cell division protein FtsZ [Kiloniellales bacterium]